MSYTVSERQRDRERQRQRDSETERKTDKQTDIQTDRDRQRGGDGHKGNNSTTTKPEIERVTTIRYRECECQDCSGMRDVLSARTGDDSVRLIRCMPW